MAPPFGFFKKRDRTEPDKDDKKSSTSPATVGLKDQPEAGDLAIQKAQEILQDVENAKVQVLCSRLAEIRNSASESFRNLARIAEDMDREKFKLENVEQRFGSTVENSKKTIVSTLRREASAELPNPQSINDAKKFRERLEATMNRFGEVSGSHSKVLNYFMNKYAEKMREEFETLSSLLKDTRSVMAEFEQNRSPVVKCNNILNTVLQKISSAKAAEVSMQSLVERIQADERELEKTKMEHDSIRGSPDFAQAESSVAKLSEVEQRIQEFHTRVSDLFSHASRAFGKYSYGVTKETEKRLLVMTDEPWRILYEDDVSPYTALLAEIQKSISSGQIQLKDSERVLRHIGTILASVSDLRATAKALAEEHASLSRDSRSKDLVMQVKKMEDSVSLYTEELAQYRRELALQKKQMQERNEEIQSQLSEASQALSLIAGKRYSIRL